jgi:hypothetical protein
MGDIRAIDSHEMLKGISNFSMSERQPDKAARQEASPLRPAAGIEVGGCSKESFDGARHKLSVPRSRQAATKSALVSRFAQSQISDTDMNLPADDQ